MMPGMKEQIRVFDENAAAYDAWFEAHQPAFASELLAIRQFFPTGGKSLEIGAGTGRFTEALGVTLGVEPAPAMAKMARARGLTIIAAVGEHLPLASAVFDAALLITTLCFLADPLRTLREASRVLKPRGRLIIGRLDVDSPLGRHYEPQRRTSKFFRPARFYPVSQVLEWLAGLSYGQVKICQTIFRPLEEITEPEPILDGYGKGYFLAIAADKGELP